MFALFNRYLIKFTILITAIVMLIITINLSFGKEKWRGVLESDAKGYFAYLPAVFIYHDLNFGFFEHIEKDKYYQEHIYFDYRGLNTKSVNKYYAGTALAQAPFFLSAHLITYFVGGELDGYSKYYLLSVPLAALFYHILGLWFLAGLLQLYKIKQTIIALMLLAATFGTHLFVYTLVEPGMSHVFSFAFIAGLLYYLKKFFITENTKYSYIIALLLGIVVLIRPINGLVLFFVFPLSGGWLTLKSSFLRLIESHKELIISFFIAFLVISIQLIIYKISTGSFFVYSYYGEGFNFLEPHILDILFSYKKGLFLYTPMLFLGFIAVLFFTRIKPFFAFTWLFFFLLITYVFSSWWMWFYGGSFSSRVYVEYIPVFIVPIALFLQHMLPKFRGVIVGLIILLIAICQVQSYQYRYYDIHYIDMNKDKYWEVFLMRNKF